jgi:hypothetical protein
LDRKLLIIPLIFALSSTIMMFIGSFRRRALRSVTTSSPSKRNRYGKHGYGAGASRYEVAPPRETSDNLTHGTHSGNRGIPSFDMGERSQISGSLPVR